MENEYIENKDLKHIKSIDKRIEAFKKGEDDEFPIKLKGFANTGYAISISEEIEELNGAVEGILKQDDYSYYLNPLNVTDEKVKKVGARLRNHNIIKGIVNLFLGEFDRQPTEYIVTTSHQGIDDDYAEAERTFKIKYIKQSLANSLIRNGVPTSTEEVEQAPIEEEVTNFKETYLNNRMSMGQEAVDYIKYNNDIDDKYVDAFYDWVVGGRCFTYKDVTHDDVDFEFVPSEQMIVPFETHSNYVEDYSWAIRKQPVTSAVLINKFGKKLPLKVYEAIKRNQDDSIADYGRLVKVGRDGYIPPVSTYVDDTCIDGVIGNTEYQAGTHTLFHYNWVDVTKVGFLYYEDELGVEQIMEVSDDYVLNKDNGDKRIEWSLENILMSAYSVDNEDFFDIKVVEHARASINNPSEIKLLYNGITNRTKLGLVQSYVKDGLPYQRLVNGVHYQLEKLINKNKDKVMVVPYGMVPRKQGMDTTETMYHVDATSILWVDETSKNASIGGQMIKVLDMSLGTFINDAIALIKEIKAEYWEVIGMNPQRFSDIGTRAGKGTTEQAIVRSSVITNDLYRKFDKLMEKDYQGLMDLSKFAWHDTKKGSYLRSDKAQAILTLNEDDMIFYKEADHKIFIKHSSIEAEAVRAMRELAQPYMQNEGSIEGVGIMYETNSVNSMKSLLRKVEQQNKEYEKLTSERDHEQAMEIETLRKENLEREEALERYKVDRDYDKTVDSAMIRANATRAAVAKPANEVEKQLAEHQISKDNRELDIKANAEQNKAINDRQANINKQQTVKQQ